MRTTRVLWLLLLLLVGGCAPESHTVTYQVEGSAAKIAISYVNETGATEQRDLAGPWSASFTTTTWRYVGVSVFNPTLEGSVTCRLYVDSVLIQEATSTGAWKVASCGALAGVRAATPTPHQ
jgi:hypothetical protein